MTVCIRSKSYDLLTLGIVIYVNSVCYEIDNRYFTLVENYFSKKRVFIVSNVPFHDVILSFLLNVLNFLGKCRAIINFG